MKRILSAVLLTLSLYNICVAQKGGDTNIVGHVIDARTGNHLAYITVTVEGTTIGTATDASGHYLLTNVPAGRQRIKASMLGFEASTAEVNIEPGTTVEVNFTLKESSISLDGVVVSANRNETARRTAPSLVNVLDTRTFEMTNSQCLAQGLNFQPGVRVEDDCQNCGFAQVRINGLDGHYSQILLDSRPIFSALSGVYGLEQIPANMIERVEIVRGGGSALFGSSAIGGTINIITREPLYNTAQLAHTITSIGCGGTFDNSTTLNASLVADNARAGCYVYGQSRHRAGYDHDGDGFTELPVISAKTVGMRSYVKTSNYSKLTLQYHGIGEYRRGGDRLDLPPHQAEIAEQVDHNIQGGGLSFDIFSPDYRNRANAYVSAQYTARKSYYGGGQDPKAYGSTRNVTLVSGVQFTHDFDRLLFMPSELTAGLEYSYDKLDDRSPDYERYTEQHTHIESFYLQNEWKNRRWGLLVGGRLDKHNLVGHVIFSPRANLRYNPSENINLRLTYSSGFRAPQTFDEDLHIAIVGGERVSIRLDDDLREERSHSVSLSADMYRTFGSVQTNLLVEGFYTSLHDVFALRTIAEDEDSGTVKERYNGSGATVAGVNIEGKASFTRWFQLQLGLTAQRSRYKEPEVWSEDEQVPAEKRLFRTPDLYGYFTATFDPLHDFRAAVSGTFTGPMTVQHMAGSGTPTDMAVRTGGFFDMAVKLSYDIHLYRNMIMQVNAGVQNLFDAYQKDFDKGADRDSGYVYGPSLPRSWFAGIKLSF